MARLTPREVPVLIALDEWTKPSGEMCVPFATLSGEPKDSAETKEVRRVVRQLARKGLAEFHRGLFTEDGDMCGSGYCISDKGRLALSESKEAGTNG